MESVPFPDAGAPVRAARRFFTTMPPGFKRIIASAKVQMLAIAAFGAVVTYFLTPGTVNEKRELAKTMVMTLGALVGAVILGWAHEDAAAKASPTSQVNVGSKVTNTPPPPSDDKVPLRPGPIGPDQSTWIDTTGYPESLLLKDADKPKSSVQP